MSQHAKGQHAFHAKPFDGEQNCEEIQNPISTLRIQKAGIDNFFRELLKEGEINSSFFTNEVHSSRKTPEVMVGGSPTSVLRKREKSEM